MNVQQKFINALVEKSESEKKPCDIDMGMFKGGARPVRQRSIKSEDFEEDEQPVAKKPKKSPKQVKATQTSTQSNEKQYKRKPVGRLKSIAL